MSDDQTEQERFAQTILEKAGPTEALLMAMRLVLLVGQRKAEDPEVIAAAQQAMAAIKKIGTLTGVLGDVPVGGTGTSGNGSPNVS
jgi:hypothetical protein